MAPPTWAWTGAQSASTTTVSPVYPASGVTAGDLIYLISFNKLDTGTGNPLTLTAPSGWTEIATGVGGTGTAGAGTGPVRCTIHKKNVDADGTENGTTLTNILTNPTASPAVLYTNVVGVRRATGGSTILHGASTGSDTTAGTAFSVTTAADPGITLDDLVLACAGWDIQLNSGASAETITSPSATIGTVTEREDVGTSSGNDIRRVVWSAACTAGTSTAAPTVTATSAASITGVGLVLRIREQVAGGATPEPLVVPSLAAIQASTW